MSGINIYQNKSMEVIKRDGRHERVSFDKITVRIEKLCWGLDPEWIDPTMIAQKTIKDFANGITTEELDDMSSKICANKIMDHPDFNKLAARICISNIHKKTTDNFHKVVMTMYNNTDIHGKQNSLVSDELVAIVDKHKDTIQEKLDFDRDYMFDYFGIQTLLKGYLCKLKSKDAPDKLVERPQHMWMRVSLGIHGNDLESAFNTYDLMSQGYFIHATPTLYNSGSNCPQMSSCFLLGMEDSLEGIYGCLKNAAMISKRAGGIGIHVQNIRSSGSLIRGTNGRSDGIIPMLQVYNNTARYVNQGGRRKGSIAIYLEPWHPDIEDFLHIRTVTGEESKKARDLFPALWVPDLFMECVRDNKDWYLMCPDECPGLTDTYGQQFVQLYNKYVEEGKYKKKLKAQKLWRLILASQIETGTPYMAYKDHVNHKSNQSNVGTIKSSNLCCEIMEYSDDKEYAVCNLASICLPAFLEEDEDGNFTYNFDKLLEVAKTATRNLNKVIDLNYYPVEETRVSNMRHRPIGLGVQGLANLFNKLHYSFGSDEARDLNKRIFETIYFGSMTASWEVAKQEGPYPSFAGSPFSEGKLQFHLWGKSESDLLMGYDWETLIEGIKQDGVRNSLLTAIMPTASTAHIMGNNECIEPFTTNAYTRSVLAGEFSLINENLVKDLLKLGLWNKDMKDLIVANNGSIQTIDGIPDDIKQVYLTAYDMPQKYLVNMAVERGPFIDQSQSLNAFMARPNSDKLTGFHFYGWKNGLKTGMYYLRGQPVVNAKLFGIDPALVSKLQKKKETGASKPKMSELLARRNQSIQRGDNYEACEMCN